jgi:hypothetical protein
MSTDNDLLLVPTPRRPAPPMQRLRAGISTRFRLPTEDDAAPPSARLLGLAFWAAACVFAGLLPAGRLMIAILFGGPAWYPPVAISIGLAGTALMAAAFGSIHRAHLPWYLMAAATILLTANTTIIYTLL